MIKLRRDGKTKRPEPAGGGNGSFLSRRTYGMAGGTSEATMVGPRWMGGWRSRVLGAAAAVGRARPQE